MIGLGNKVSKSCGITLKQYTAPYTAKEVKDLVFEISNTTDELIE